LSVHQRLSALSGTLNTAGSSITKTFGDGRAVVYRYEVASEGYESTEGEGAHDTLSYSGGQWTWTEGSTRIRETYNEAGQFTATRDADDNVVSYGYSGDLLTRITDASGQVTTLEYHAGTPDLAWIRVSSNNHAGADQLFL
jgi:YD repeat-containing protein